MEKVFTKFTVLSILFLLFVSITFAQAPQASTYQAVARDGSGNILQNQSIGLRFTVLKGSSSGTTVYQETQTTSTNSLGIFSVNVGQGTVLSGTFSGITWASGTFYLEVEMDPTGGTSYTEMGTPQQMMSVPYALNAANGVPASTGATQPQYLATTTTGGTPVFRNPQSKFNIMYNIFETINSDAAAYYQGIQSAASGAGGLPAADTGLLTPYALSGAGEIQYGNYIATSACTVNACSGWFYSPGAIGKLYVYLYKMTPVNGQAGSTNYGFALVGNISVSVTAGDDYFFNMYITSANASMNPGDMLMVTMTPANNTSSAVKLLGSIEMLSNVQ